MRTHGALVMPQLTQVQSTEEIEIVRHLLREYQQELGIDLCFQGFEAELEGLPGGYTPPSGRLLMARHDGTPIGCIALQRLDASRCEMKRLYVRRSARGLAVGRKLVRQLLLEAKGIGYSEIVLDTLPSMIEAQRLYEQFGFHDIEPYRPNPIAGTRYMGRKL
jgi:putative acetyltransferase